MLDSETKKHIDAARDILVGKVPEPKAQVDQITTAMVYKFMDDMDRNSQILGGAPKFLTGKYEKYRWANIIDKKLSGIDRLNLYDEAIKKMFSNENLEPLFRDFFKGAFLPFQDPETLSLFLKEINYFAYDNSEVLGNAFEYLLSVLGSQGDAGQFRTPRHIIDFIVEAVDPKKDDTISDPACGTAGFLISAYNHIVKNNSSKFLEEKKSNIKKEVKIKDITEQVIEKELYGGDLFKTDEKEKLVGNIVGYDISPDMVKLAQVNMFLHDFLKPHIYEYDTLTSESRWGESFSIILANPPFMTPRGGIRPHNKFSIKANRAEILFIDYILDHLHINGRAGIIVPEGILVNTNAAYRSIREKLLDDKLLAVISLPNGVFKPYSGVKTSILIIDKKLASEKEQILFINIENDGFDLGDQRRKIDDDDLPEALKVLKHWKDGEKHKSSKSHWISKKKILSQRIQTLDVRNYINDRSKKPGTASSLPLGNIMELSFGKRITKNKDYGTKYPVYGGGNASFMTDDYNRENEYVIARFAMSANCVRRVKGEFWLLDSGATFNIKNDFIEKTTTDYIGLLLLFKQDEIYACSRGAAQKNLDIDRFNNIKIPFPSIEVQREIANEIGLKDSIIENAYSIINSLGNEKRQTSHSINILEKANMKELGDLCIVNKGSTITREKTKKGDIPVIAGGKKPAYYHNKSNHDGNVVTIAASGSAGFVSFFDYPIYASDCITIVSKDEEKLITKFVYIILSSYQDKIYQLQKGSGVPHVYARDLVKIKIPVPSIDIQKQMVMKSEEEENIVIANKKIIEIKEQEIAEIIQSV